MTDAARALQGAFGPLGALTPGKAVTVGTAATLLFDDIPTYGVRRVHVVNTHATQDLAVIIEPRGTGSSAQTTASSGTLPVLARSTGSFLIQATQSIFVAGSGAATTFIAASSDT